MQKTVKVNFHGVLQEFGKSWNLAIHSVGEAVHAINTIKKGRLNKTLMDNDKKGIKYRVLINGRDFLCEETPTLDKPETISRSELSFKFEEGKLETLDFVPVLEGAQDFFAVIAGALLIIIGVVVGVVFGWTGIGGVVGFGLIMAGLGLVAAGVMNLLSKPPKFEDFRDFSGPGRAKASYLFNGPENVEKEGGPVPVLYGRLLVGSQVISTSYEVTDRQITDVGITI